MEERVIQSKMQVCKLHELPQSDQILINEAIKATERSYAPFSHFHVGAALRLANGETVTGCNQENAAFSVTICAERTALFTAGNRYHDVAIEAIAIAARNRNGLLAHPVSPCGSCRQAMIETETRFKHPIRILLYGQEQIFVLEGIKSLMPLSFEDLQ